MYTCLIIDDEQRVISSLSDYISGMPQLHLIKSYTDPELAVRDIENGDIIDFLFLDVDMPKLSGLEIAAMIRHKVRCLVFATAHTKYGYQAFELEGDAFLLKPYSFSKFELTISKLIANKLLTKPTQLSREFFMVKNKDNNYVMQKVIFADIIAVESKKNYIKIHTVSCDVTAYLTLAEMIVILQNQSGFAQFHRSFVIGINHINSIDGSSISMSQGLRFNVGDSYRHSFLEFLANYSIRTERGR
ncbi:response regulator transcription factor [Pedobacter polaris]|uniref:Response regulator transcription factor n=1 Tax=Pedobacter polaris TaxID=2571273 RepID=A0A4U1CTA1_9SPHI|nr:LytTR family DNA-binding domain-containing protein [Pedobacter polaris]TKC12407.1 response regulator transcription factor [Pedobacter polaris]